MTRRIGKYGGISMMKFSEQFLKARKASGLTQAEVAERLSVSVQTVSLWERGENVPSIEKLPEIASIFDVSTDWLLIDSEEDELIMDIQENLSDRLFNEERMYTYVKTYALVKQMYQTLKVLPYARELHKGQYRKGKDKVPYIYHPLLLACHAIALGLDDDNLVSVALLHDVCEDCGVLAEDLPVNEVTKNAVALLTKDKTYGVDKEKEYYDNIFGNEIALMVKLLDRCNNVSGMAAAFDTEKLVEYIKETEQWFLPMMQKAKTEYPMYSSQIFLIKYHIVSVMEAIKHQL